LNGLDDPLHEVYGIAIRMASLDVHVGTEAGLVKTGRFVFDPSVGLMLPFGMRRAGSDLEWEQELYEVNAKSYSSRASIFDRKGDIATNPPRARGYSPTPP
jgi:hypothetical protein